MSKTCIKQTRRWIWISTWLPLKYSTWSPALKLEPVPATRIRSDGTCHGDCDNIATVIYPVAYESWGCCILFAIQIIEVAFGFHYLVRWLQDSECWYEQTLALAGIQPALALLASCQVSVPIFSWSGFISLGMSRWLNMVDIWVVNVPMSRKNVSWTCTQQAPPLCRREKLLPASRIPKLPSLGSGWTMLYTIILYKHIIILSGRHLSLYNIIKGSLGI